MKEARNDTVDALRGVAALLVCGLHFTHNAFRPGFLGVPIFFVISGFILPYSLNARTYKVGDWPIFMAKRIVRLYPPYVASIILVVALAFALAAGVMLKGQNAPANLPDFSVANLAAHALYANGILGWQWLNGAYWTLAIELQYYALIGVLFPFAISAHRLVRYLFLAGLIAVGLLLAPWRALVFPFLPCFAAGIATFQFSTNRLQVTGYAIAIALSAAATLYTVDATYAVGTVIGSLTIATIRARVPRWLLFFGAISYSIYLVHWPVGIPLVDIIRRYRPDSVFIEAVALLVGSIATVTVSYILYRLLELPATAWSRRLRYPGGGAAFISNEATPTPAMPVANEHSAPP